MPAEYTVQLVPPNPEYLQFFPTNIFKLIEDDLVNSARWWNGFANPLLAHCVFSCAELAGGAGEPEVVLQFDAEGVNGTFPTTATPSRFTSYTPNQQAVGLILEDRSVGGNFGRQPANWHPSFPR